MESMLHKIQQQHLLLPTLLLKQFAVQASNWYKRQAASPNAVAPPDFESVFDDIEMERPWMPSLSLGFLHALNLTDFYAGGQNPLAPNNDLGGAGNGGSNAGGGGMGGGPGGHNGGANERTNNTNFCAALFGAYRAMAISCHSLRNKIARNKIPQLPSSKVDNNPMCLAWHTKGVCNLACSRRIDHVAYTNDEYQELVQWCAAHFHE